jgi:glyoxylase-like metal-dependent hydrolase (beta-lactamase superfamily II)
VIHTPGHTPGHVIYFRRSDGVAVAGDIVRNGSLRAGFGELSHTPSIFNADTPLNREAVKVLFALRPTLLCLGHGPPSKDIEALARLAGDRP